MSSRLGRWSVLLGIVGLLRGCGGESTGGSTLGATCGGETGMNCAPSEYCAYEPGADCGRADATATCQDRPEACPGIYAPVCGCDGKTYSSACVAAAAGVGYEREGPCDEGKACGGIAGLPCAEGQYCHLEVGQCLVPDAGGVCRAKPEACDLVYAPVCGCDGATYGNACAAAAAGTSVAAEGECTPTGPA